MGDKLSVLRESRRVLEPGGLMVGYVIHTPPGLGAAAGARAAELGPSKIVAAESYATMLDWAGFSRVSEEDVTTAFAQTAAALLEAREALVDVLRAGEGEKIYQEEYSKLRDMVSGIDEGLVRRALIVAMA